MTGINKAEQEAQLFEFRRIVWCEKNYEETAYKNW